MKESASIARHFGFQRAAVCQCVTKGYAHRQHSHTIADESWSQPMSLAAIQFVLCRVPNETAVIVHLIHDRITGINAQCTLNAFVLETIANIDSRWADLDA